MGLYVFLGLSVFVLFRLNRKAFFESLVCFGSFYVIYNVYSLSTFILSLCIQINLLIGPPHWGAADAEIKVPSGENTELKRSPFKAWSGSVYSHACYVYCQEFLPCLFLTFQSIHLHFVQNLSRFFLCWLWLRHSSCAGPQNEIGHPARCRFPC